MTEDGKLTREEIQWIDETLMNDPSVKKWVEGVANAFIAHKTLSCSNIKVKNE